MFAKKKSVAASSAVSTSEDDDAAEEPPAMVPRRRSTVKRLLQQGERDRRNTEIEAKIREEEEPLCKLIPMKVALQLRDVASALARELPQDISEARLARLRAPKSSTGAVLREGASVSQAATHAALKALEQWVRILRPFATSSTLGELIARIVHMDVSSSKEEGWIADEQKYIEVLPPSQQPFGAAIRRIVPTPERLALQRWEWIEDVQQALFYEESFDRSSFVHRSAPSGSVPSSGESTASARPKTTGYTKKRLPEDPSARMRLSGDFAWAGFQNTDGFRTTQTSVMSEKYIRKLPGPGVYGDYVKHLARPGTAPRAVYPSVGERRAQCFALPLSQLDRFFKQDFRLE